MEGGRKKVNFPGLISEFVRLSVQERSSYQEDHDREILTEGWFFSSKSRKHTLLQDFMAGARGRAVSSFLYHSETPGSFRKKRDLSGFLCSDELRELWDVSKVAFPTTAEKVPTSDLWICFGKFTRRWDRQHSWQKQGIAGETQTTKPRRKWNHLKSPRRTIHERRLGPQRLNPATHWKLDCTSRVGKLPTFFFQTRALITVDQKANVRCTYQFLRFVFWPKWPKSKS